jgi:hypothetical protein
LQRVAKVNTPRLAAVAAVGLTLAAGLGLSLLVGLAAAEPAWEGETIILTRAGGSRGP